MDAMARLQTLTSQMHLEAAEDYHCPQLPGEKRVAGMLHNAVMPGGKPFTLMKTLLTSACERDCFYCPFRAGRNYRRTTLKPQEMAQTFMSMNQKGAVEGLFLSSGIVGGGIRTQDKIIETAEILRNQLNFRGYLHLKIMPGAEKSQVERTMQLASRVSINLEAANDKRLPLLAPQKNFLEELLQPLRWVEEIRRNITPQGTWNRRWPSSVTQFVVGATGESDVELLATSEHLYHQLRLSRTYFSAFFPVSDTPMENKPPTSPRREQRLYQASFLLRDYGFSMEELPFGPGGNLPENVDPKTAWAERHLRLQPVEINRANREELLRIPGIGPRSAAVIMNGRRHGRITHLKELQKMGILPLRAIPFILINGRRPTQQLPLF
jgi:predicted DNA-binding helix-hairpin-helix protein